MKATFENTINILINAYMNDSLRHGDCEACAVGNIIHAAGFKRYGYNGMPPDSCGIWKVLFFTSAGRQVTSYYNNDPDIAQARKMIEATGYSVDDLKKVEFAFEMAPKEGDRMFNGLMAVVDVLAEIHGIDLTTKEEAKKLFVKE